MRIQTDLLGDDVLPERSVNQRVEGKLSHEHCSNPGFRREHSESVIQ